MLLPGSTSKKKKEKGTRQRKRALPNGTPKKGGRKNKEVQPSSLHDRVEATNVGTDASLLLSGVSQASHWQSLGLSRALH